MPFTDSARKQTVDVVCRHFFIDIFKKPMILESFLMRMIRIIHQMRIIPNCIGVNKRKGDRDAS
jgi:hypothetical protein